jgi:hypothetical protein
LYSVSELFEPAGFVFFGRQSTGLGDEKVSGSEQGGKGNKASDEAPEHAGPLFLNCCLKHSNYSSPLMTRMMALLIVNKCKNIPRALAQSQAGHWPGPQRGMVPARSWVSPVVWCFAEVLPVM